MELDIIILYAMAILGPVMIFLTHYVAKGRSRDMTRLWFITFIAFIVYYWLADSNYVVDPVASSMDMRSVADRRHPRILDRGKAHGKGSLAHTLFQVHGLLPRGSHLDFVLDGIGGLMKWYTYNPAVLDKSAMINPISGLQVPAVIPFLMGIVMIGVFLLNFNLHKILRDRRIDETSATLLLSALAVVMSGFVWGATEVIISVVRSLM